MDRLCWSTPDPAVTCDPGMHFESSVMACRPDLTAPQIHIEPRAPIGTDDLSTVIDVATVDSRAGSGPVTYTYAWSRNGAAVTSEADAVVSADVTARDEVWSVVVTPVTDEGLRGPSATAMVTIANSAPVLRTVGLSSYGPIVGETLQMLPGPSSDADGDTVSYEFEWVADGTTIAGSTTAFLTGFTADQHILGRARATDGSATSDWVQVGPITTLADVTRWRALLPQREIGSEGFVEYDEPNDRLIVYAPADSRFASTQLWEYPLHGDGQFRELFPTGTSPRSTAPGYDVDTTNHRILVFGGVDRVAMTPTNSLYALELVRGAERWVEIHATGTPPVGGAFARLVDDGPRHRMLASSGFSSSDVPNGPICALDVGVAGAESWTCLTDAQTGFATFVRDDRRSRWVVLFASLTAAPSALAIADDGRAAAVGAVLEGLLLRSAVALDPDADRAVLLFGSAPAVGAARAVSQLDLATLTLSPLVATGSMPEGGELQAVADRRPDGRYIVWPGNLRSDRGRLSFYEFDATAGSWAVLRDDAAAGPPAVQSPVVLYDNRITGGITSFRDVDDSGIWTYASARWSRVPLPLEYVPRYGFSGFDPGATQRPLDLWGGAVGDGSLADQHEWSMVDLTDKGPVPAPSVSYGSAIISSGCGGEASVLVGGIDSAGHSVATVQGLDCRSSPCVRTVYPDAPMPLSWAVATTNGGQLVFGGADGSTAQPTLYSVRCIGPTSYEWTAVDPTGTDPPARYGHSMTTLVTAARNRTVVFGGQANRDEALNDAWILRSEGGGWSWSQILPAGSVAPCPRAFSAAWSDGPGRVLVYGGRSPLSEDVLSDLWELRIRP